MAAIELRGHVRPALVSLQEMLKQFWSKELPGAVIPLEFWKIDDDDLFFDALQYLPSCMSTCGGSSGQGHSAEDIAALPEGFQVAFAIFELEDGFDNEGWSAICNLGEDQLRLVIQAYKRVGLNQRAAALERVLAAYLASPDDDQDAYAEAAAGELPDLRENEEAINVLFAFLRADRDALFGKLT